MNALRSSARTRSDAVDVGKNEWEDFVHIRQGYCYWKMQPSGRPMVYGLHVDPMHRRQGFAQLLLSLVIDRVRASGYSGQIEIEASPVDGSVPRERLVKLYESLGLTVVSSALRAQAQPATEREGT